MAVFDQSLEFTMKLSFCTLFDSNYLSRGLTMYESLSAHCKEFHLYIFAFDDLCLQILNQLQLKEVTIISLSEFEDDELLKIKDSRTPVEYCWTCTPSIIRYCLNHFQLEMCTYLDADLFFFSSPEPIFKELGEKSILITEHRFSKKYEEFIINGIYNVQFVTFRNDLLGRKALEYWRNSCNEWCYFRLENGKLGDQKYLDDWTTRFDGVHVLQNLGGGIGPWNVQQYFFELKDGALIGVETETKKKFNAIFFHFHGLKMFQNGYAKFTFYDLSEDIFDLIYTPYTYLLLAQFQKLKILEPKIKNKGYVLDDENPYCIKNYFNQKNYFGDNYFIYNLNLFQKFSEKLILTSKHSSLKKLLKILLKIKKNFL